MFSDRQNLISICAAIVCVAAIGCQGPGFTPATLPYELHAPAVHSAAHIDLSHLAQTSVPSELIQTGDVLEVVVATGYDKAVPTKWSLRVGDDGSANVPLVGQVQIAGLMPTQAERKIRDESIRRGIYRNPQVSVQHSDRQSHHVTVTGAVDEPGVYELPVSGSDLLAALVQAGGLTEDAGTIIEIRHPPKKSVVAEQPGPDGVQPAGHQSRTRWTPARTIHVDLVKKNQANDPDLRLQDGTVVVVPKKPSRTIQVLGLVTKPGQFEMPPDQDVRMLDAVALAGGRTMQVADSVTITRFNPFGPQPVVINASVRQAKSNQTANVRLSPGDVVSVEETPLTFTLDTLRSFIRFGFTSGIPGF